MLKTLHQKKLKHSENISSQTERLCSVSHITPAGAEKEKSTEKARHCDDIIGWMRNIVKFKLIPAQNAFITLSLSAHGDAADRAGGYQVAVWVITTLCLDRAVMQRR